MSSEFSTITLGGILNFSNGKSSPERFDNGKCFVFGANGAIGRANETNSPSNSIIVGRVGSYCGAVHFSKSACWVTDNAIKATAKDDNDPSFLSYLLRQLNLNNWRSGSGQPLINQSTLNSIEVRIPRPAEQREIGYLISSLDNRIALLRETNATLEAIAQTLFKSWFVDFDPVHTKQQGREPEDMDADTAALFPDSFEESELGLVPKGWDMSALYDIADYINGAAYKAFEPNLDRRGLPIIKIAELKAGVTSQTAFSDVSMPEKYRIGVKDILFSWSGNPDTSIDTFVWSHSNAWLNQHIFRVIPNLQNERSLVLLMLKHMKLVFAEIARNKQTTGLGHVTVADLKRLRVVKPNALVLQKWNEIVDPLIERAFIVEQQAQTLTILRDTLLPRLISGQLRLPEALDTDA